PGGAEGVEIEPRAFEIEHEADKDDVGTAGEGFEQRAEQQPYAEPAPALPVRPERGMGAARTGGIGLSSGKSGGRSQQGREQPGGQGKRCRSAQDDAQPIEPKDDQRQGKAAVNVAGQERRPERALGAQG